MSAWVDSPRIIWLRGRTGRRILAYLAGFAAPSISTGVIAAINHAAGIPNISLLYLPSILLVAVYFGTGPSLTAATVSVVEYDFFLLRPLYTFSISQAQDVLAFVVFMGVALLTSQLAAGPRSRVAAAQRRARESETLYALGQALMAGRDLTAVLEAIVGQVQSVFDLDGCAIYIPDAEMRVQLVAETPRRSRAEREHVAAAGWVYEQGTEVSIPTAGRTWERESRMYLPLRTADRTLGVMEIGSRRSGEPFDTEEQRLVTSVAAQAALVIARAEGDQERTRREIVEESDRLKSSLLSAVSHDLRTPLAAIKAAATALLMPDSALPVEGRRELLTAIDQEADRLNRLVGNLLDLSRIEAGVLHPVLDWYSLRDVLDAILPRLQPLVPGRPLTVDVQEDIPPVHLDLARIEELLYNLFENVAAYTEPDSPVTLRVRREHEGLTIAVVDHGSGIPSWQRDRLFEGFYRGLERGDRHPGTGLGLAICRGIAEAHGGTMTAEETPGGGATFVLALPASLVGQEV